MKTKFNKKHVAELRRIGESIPKSMQDRLIIKRDQLPTVNKVVSLALHDDNVPEKQKERLRNIKAAGLLNKKVDVVNKTAQKEIDNYLNQEIAKSIAAGRLPKPKDNTLFDKYIKKCRRKAKDS
jgi:hypothetical protein